jgi:hypothetical protein
MRDVLLLEAPDGFIVQGLVIEGGTGTWSESVGHQAKETLTFLDDDIARFMDEAMARRGAEAAGPPDWSKSGYYEKSFRVIGRWMDSQRPHDIFFFEQGGAFVVRLQKVTATGAHHELAEFTKEDIEAMITEAPQLRLSDAQKEAGQ